MMRQSCDCGCKVKTVAHQFTVLAAGWPWPGTPLQHLHTREGRQLKINSRDRFYTFYPRHTAPRPAHHTADPRFCDILLANVDVSLEPYIKCHGHGVKRTCHLIFRITIRVRVVGVKEGPKSVRFVGKSRIFLHIFRVTAWDLSRAWNKGLTKVREDFTITETAPISN